MGHRRGGFSPWLRSMKGATRTEAAKIVGVTLQIVRDWVLKFNARGPEGSLNRKAPGQPSRLKDEHRKNGPIPAIHGVMRWRLVDLCQWVFEEFRIHVAGLRLDTRTVIFPPPQRRD
jgi:transposase